MKVEIKKLHPDAIIPVYRMPGDAGFDLHCLEDTVIPPESVVIIPTGLAFAIPDGFEMQIRMRSGTSLKTPLILANAPGTIDSGYRGEVGIITRNLGKEPFKVSKGDRIAQGVITPVLKAQFEIVEELPDTERAASGFGSTGKD